MRTVLRMTTVAAALVGGCLTAQDSVGTLVGTIRNTQGAVVPGVKLTLSSPAILGSRSGVTNERGEFRMPLLPAGDYSLTVSKENYVGSKATFRVNTGQVLRQDFTVREVAVQGAIVEVSGSAMAAQVDKTETRTVTNVTAEKLEALPGGKTSADALLLSPGMTGSQDRPSFRGGIQGAAQFYVGGISIKDGNQRYGRQTAYVMTDLTEEIQVSQSPLNAKYGNSSGGRVDVTSKSGTNEFSGSFRVTVDRNSWGAFNAPVYKRRAGIAGADPHPGDLMDVDDLTKEYQVTLLGPIIPGKLTFSYGRTWSPKAMNSAPFVNLWANDRTRYIQTISGTTGGNAQAYTWGTTVDNPTRTLVRQDNLDVVNQLKLFWILNTDHQVEAFYTSNTYGPNLDASNNTAATRTFPQLDETNIVQASLRQFYGINYRGLLGQGVVDVQLGRTKKRINFSSGPGDPILVRLWASNAQSLQNNYDLSGSFATEGDLSYPWRNLRQNDQFKANYTWSNEGHTADFGLEWLRETYKATNAVGPNEIAFYTPGIRFSGADTERMYQVFNYFQSPLTNPAAPNYLPIVAAGNAFVPEMRTWETFGDNTNKDDSYSAYANDMWTFSSHLSLMGGVRYDKWSVKNRQGTAISGSGLSPRFEAKYDLFGDSRHVFNASYAVFRGTIGAGILGSTFARYGGNISNRYFWNVGPAVAPGGSINGPGNWVTKAQLKDPANYRLYSVADVDLGHEIDPNLRPEKNTQYEVGYRRAFEKGGFFRVALAYNRFSNLIYRRGYYEIAQLDTPGKTPFVSSSQIRSRLEIDPYNNRSSRSMEMEFDLPLYRSGSQRVNLGGFWTSVRARGRATWGEDLGATTVRFYELAAQNGLSVDDVNSYGEYASSLHNKFSAWITWTAGNPKGLQSTIAFKGDYLSGQPYSLTLNKAISLAGVPPAETVAGTPRYASDTPSNLGQFLNHRGAFTDPDTFAVDFKWNLDYPVVGKVRLFSQLTVANIFNTILATGYRHDVTTTNQAASVNTFRQHTSFWFRAGYPVTGNGNMYSNPFMGRRNFELSGGIRF